MQTLLALLLMQYVVSVKAGLVNHVQGNASVVERETAAVGSPIRTGTDGYVEVLLSPGSFLRLGEDSEARIDDENLQSVRVTVLRGPAVIEVVEIPKESPITVTTGNLTTRIIDSGIYRFADGTATVIQGKLQTKDSQFTYEKGWQVFFKDSYRARKTGKIQATSLDVYSQARSEVIARANYSLTSSLNGPSTYGIYNSWLYTPYIGVYTFIPRSGFRSPYGYQYYGIGARRVASRSGNNGSDNSSSNTTTPSQSTGNTPNDSGNGGGNSAPAPTASTPSGERTAPAVYIESKSSTVGATAR